MYDILKRKEIFIPGNVPSLKNSKVKTSMGIFPSKTVKNYLKSFGIKSYSSGKKTVEYYKKIENKLFIDYFTNEIKLTIREIQDANMPIGIHLHFIRGTKHKFDFNNASQIILDLMTAYNIIEDDNMDCIIPFPLRYNGKWYSYSKTNPGVLIRISTGL